MKNIFPYYLSALIFCSIIIFLILTSSLGTISPSTDFLLSMILSHLILDKNLKLIYFLKNRDKQNKSD